jgi:predicted dehydrogenase
MNRLYFSRRRFVAGSLTAATLTIIPRSALGLGGKPPSARINMGFIGTGTQGTQHIAGGPWTTTGGFLGRDDTQVVAVCDVETPRRDAARQRVEAHYAEKQSKGQYNGCKSHADFRDLLADRNIDAVLIATPDHWHALMSILAMRAGKDVYCEKPMTLTIREAQQVRDEVRRTARIFQAGTQQRSSPAFRRACELVRNGFIGRVQRVHVNVGGTSLDFDAPAEPVPKGVDWNMWLGPAPWRPYSSRIHRPWMAHRDYSGGEMTNWGAHHFDIAQWGLGMDESGPAEIIPPDGKDHPTLTYRFASGALLHHGGHALSGVTFIGADGMVNTDRWYCRTEPARINREAIPAGGVRLYESSNHHDNFLECVRTRSRPAADVNAISRSITLCHLGNIAYWLKRPLKWDPATERFVNDEVANRWLDRAKRAPWGI